LWNIVQSGACFATTAVDLYEEMNTVTTAMLLGQLALALGFLGFITRALVERMQDLGLLAGDKG
jgi:hypothetical protein|tara:strand:- start:1077 stop:1268 length:192 start_codon:yes stop_codon:yes gene_type:complete